MADLFKKNDLPIKKHILHTGKGDIPIFKDGSKVSFHYVTRLINDEHTEIDNSKKDSKGTPMELIFGKKFKLEAWEKCLETMRVHEVASFIVHPSLLVSYPNVMKTLRDVRQGKPTAQRKHCCGGMGMKEAQHTGYDDLDKLLKEAQPLEFILELLTYSGEGTYEKDTWAMNDNEKHNKIPELKTQADNMFREKRYKEAAESYGKALGMLEQLMLREKPRDEPWLELEQQKIPFLLNFSQCKLFLGDYYPVIEHTTEVLEKSPNNVKAFFRRAKAHVAVWNPNEAKADFAKVVELDKSLQGAVKKELAILNKMQAERDAEDRKILAGKLIS